MISLSAAPAEDLPKQFEGQPVYRVGSGVTPPKALNAPDPPYSEEARKKKVQGTVLLRVIIGPDGKAHNVVVTRSVGYGLDEKAVESVKQWTFQPSELNGTAVPVVINIEVRFHLYDKFGSPLSR
jgi:TonB family protein